MKILMINKFLHPNGGAESYVFRLGACLQAQGHAVEYFGMDHPDRVVGNRAEAYTKQMDFHNVSGLKKLTYGFTTIYSVEARRKLRQVLESFCPDVCHLNNFHYQLTPSILLEIDSWSKRTGHSCKILATAHDYQLICPNHMCRNGRTRKNCEKCLSGHVSHCAADRCIHGSLAKSLTGMLEAWFWKAMGVYRRIDRIVCCSHFLKTKLDRNPVLAERTVVTHNFVSPPRQKKTEKKDYVLYFGRLAEEKGILTLAAAAGELPQIPFVFAGSGPCEKQLKTEKNVRTTGFLQGEALETLIREARLTVCPSECYENCPLSVMESICLGTPVLGANIGGIPELIRPGVTGELFESGNKEELKRKIQNLWEHPLTLDDEAAAQFQTVEAYAHKLMKWYEE